MFINNLSNSKYDTWRQCKLKYKFKYVDYFPEPSGENTKALHFGSYIHKVLEEGNDATTLEELIAISEIEKLNYEIHPSYEGKDTLCFENFLKFNASLGKTVGTEWVYQIELAPTINQNGIIDRIIEGANGGLLVIDYKTSKREKTKVELYQDKQLQGYVLACSIKHNVPVEKIIAAHYYPLTNNLVTVKYSNIQIGAFKRTMIDEVWKIRKTKKEELKPSRNQFCNWCAFQGACPQFSKPESIDECLKVLGDLKAKKDEARKKK